MSNIAKVIFSDECTECQSPVTESRRGLCLRCYQNEYNGRIMEDNCAVCGFSEKKMLTRRRLDRVNWTTLCGNCAQLAGKRKISVEQLKYERNPDGDRRTEERRIGSRRKRKRLSKYL